MNKTMSLSEKYRCSSVEVMAVSDDLAWWKREMKTMWYFGESFSIFGFMLLMLTAYLFPSWRRNEQSKFWMQMCFSYLIFTIVYVNRDFGKCKTPFIIFTSIYLGQVAFCWMLAGAWLANKRLVIVFDDEEKGLMLKATLFSWLTPLPFDFLRLALDMIDFPDILFVQKKFKMKFSAYRISLKSILDFIYYLKDIGMYFPVVLAISGSVLIYGKVMFVLWKNRRDRENRQDLYGTVGIIVLFILMSGVQFMFVILYRFYTFTRLDLFLAFMVTFEVFINSVLFLFAIKSTRQLWVSYIRAKFCKKRRGHT